MCVHIRRIGGVVLVMGMVLAGTSALPVARADDLCPMERVPEERLRRHESELLSLINRERASRGLQTISVHGQVVSVAREHAWRMASEGRVYHNPSYQEASFAGVESVGEVPANGCSVRDVHDLVMGSPADRSTMLVPEWSEGGVGMASNDAGKLFVVEAFAQPLATTAAGRPPPGNTSGRSVRYSGDATPRSSSVGASATSPSRREVGIEDVVFERVDGSSRGRDPEEIGRRVAAPDPALSVRPGSSDERGGRLDRVAAQGQSWHPRVGLRRGTRSPGDRCTDVPPRSLPVSRWPFIPSGESPPGPAETGGPLSVCSRSTLCGSGPKLLGFLSVLLSEPALQVAVRSVRWGASGAPLRWGVGGDPLEWGGAVPLFP